MPVCATRFPGSVMKLESVVTALSACYHGCADGPSAIPAHEVRDITKRLRTDGRYSKRGKVTVKGRPGEEISGAVLASIWRQADLPKPQE